MVRGDWKRMGARFLGLALTIAMVPGCIIYVKGRDVDDDEDWKIHSISENHEMSECSECEDCPQQCEECEFDND